MIRTYLHIGLVAAALGAGCTEQGKTAQTNSNKAYYHDRRVGLGTNIPRTYADANSAAANDTHQSQLDQEEFQRMSTSGAATGGSGTR